MFIKYNAVLRAAGETAPPVLKKETGILCMRNKYTTTLHGAWLHGPRSKPLIAHLMLCTLLVRDDCTVINSSIVKLGKLTIAGTVYRGLSGGTLPEEFWQANEYGVCGGCEYAFMSTTLDRRVAYNYAGGSKVATILEICMGMVDRGADVAWLSQYPGEQEILFAPLTGLEVVGKRVVGGIIVVEVRLNVNLMALTIEQVIAKMQRSHIQMLDTMIDRQKQDLTGASALAISLTVPLNAPNCNHWDWSAHPVQFVSSLSPPSSIISLSCELPIRPLHRGRGRPAARAQGQGRGARGRVVQFAGQV